VSALLRRLTVRLDGECLNLDPRVAKSPECGLALGQR
jgi:hypothetical protein